MVKIKEIRWSALSSWEYSKEQWFNTYGRPLLGLGAIEQKSPELSFGSMVDQKIQDDPTFIPSLPRYPIMQHRMKVVYDGILLTGTADGVDLTSKNCRLADYKTGNSKYPWTAKRTREHGQLKMYALLIFISTKIPPEKFKYFIHWLPTKKSDQKGDFSGEIISFRDDPVIPVTFETKITMADILKFCIYIKKTVKDMEDFIHLRESTARI